MKNKEDLDRFYYLLNDFISRSIKFRGMTERDFASRNGFSVSSFYNKITLTNGRFNILELMRIAENLGMSLDEMIGKSGARKAMPKRGK